MSLVADGIGALVRSRGQFGYIRHELSRDRIVRIGAVNQLRDVGTDRDRIALGNARQIGKLLGRRQAGRDQFRWQTDCHGALSTAVQPPASTAPARYAARRLPASLAGRSRARYRTRAAYARAL